ncbi:alpha/beta-hydrolase [Lactarius tabidus]
MYMGYISSHTESPSIGVRYVGRALLRGPISRPTSQTPKTDFPNDKAILFLTELFGLELNNNLLIDAFACNGFKVYASDLFEGDPVDQNAFEPIRCKNHRYSSFASLFYTRFCRYISCLTDDLPTVGIQLRLNTWLPNHTTEHTGKCVLKVIEELKSKGITVFGATGYCYSARLVFSLTFENIVRFSVITLPSFLKSEDLNIYTKKSKAPLLGNSCEVNPPFLKELAEAADEKFAKFEPGYKRTFWEGFHHGFAVHGDLTNPAVIPSREGSSKATVEWFINHMQ